MSNVLYGWYYIDYWNGLTQDEKETNARLAMTYLRQHGFTIYAAAGIVGNMWAESMMNPGQWEGDTAYSGGYGLVQWTPYTLYSTWAGQDWENNGPKEMERLSYERENGLEFYPSTTYPQWTWTSFAAMAPVEGMTENETVDLAASVFVYNYLRPADPASTEANRKYHARYVFEYCPGTAIPYWLLFKMSKLNRHIYWR